MSDEKYCKPDIVPLSAYIESKIASTERQIVALDELMDAKLEALALAVSKQEQAYNLRFEGVNEWRQTYADLVSKAISRETFDTKMEEFNRRMGAAESRLSNFDGRIIGYSAGIGIVVLIISIVIQFAGK